MDSRAPAQAAASNLAWMRLPPRPRDPSAPERRDRQASVPTVPGRAPRWQRRFRRHRRIAAALLTGVVVWSVTTAIRPPLEPTARVLVASRDLVPGEILGPDDVAVLQRPAYAVPRDALDGGTLVVGRTIAFPVASGEAVAARHVVSSALLEMLGADVVATPVRLADSSLAALVSAGDVVDVIAASASGDGSGAAVASVVAARVHVLIAPGRGTAGGGGLLAAPASSSGDGSTVVLATSTSQALAIARAAVGSRLSVTIRGR